MTATMKGLEDEKSKLMATTKAEKEQLKKEVKEGQAKLATTNETVSNLQMKIIEVTNQSMGLINEKTAMLQTISSMARKNRSKTQGTIHNMK